MSTLEMTAVEDLLALSALQLCAFHGLRTVLLSHVGVVVFVAVSRWRTRQTPVQ